MILVMRPTDTFSAVIAMLAVNSSLLTQDLKNLQ
jgi:hypothetical protein